MNAEMIGDIAVDTAQNQSTADGMIWTYKLKIVYLHHSKGYC